MGCYYTYLVCGSSIISIDSSSALTTFVSSSTGGLISCSGSNGSLVGSNLGIDDSSSGVLSDSISSAKSNASFS